jgi:exonuclease VII small subunit
MTMHKLEGSKKGDKVMLGEAIALKIQLEDEISKIKARIDATKACRKVFGVQHDELFKLAFTSSSLSLQMIIEAIQSHKSVDTEREKLYSDINDTYKRFSETITELDSSTAELEASLKRLEKTRDTLAKKIESLNRLHFDALESELSPDRSKKVSNAKTMSEIGLLTHRNSISSPMMFKYSAETNSDVERFKVGAIAQYRMDKKVSLEMLASSADNRSAVERLEILDYLKTLPSETLSEIRHLSNTAQEAYDQTCSLVLVR